MIELNNLVRPNILKMQPYSSARDEYNGQEGTFLDANESPYGTLNRYPDPFQREIKQKLSVLKGVSTNNIFLGNGSDEVIDLALRIFCQPRVEKALTFSPSYGMYGVSASINDVQLLTLPLTPSFQIDISKLLPYFRDSALKLIFICSPNNPTGNLIDNKDIEYILNTFTGIVLVDEAYIDFANQRSLIAWTQKYNNLIVCQTFSKAWGLAAARVGVAYSNSDIISLFNKVKPPYNLSHLNQSIVQCALENYRSIEKQTEDIIAERERVIAKMEHLKTIKKIYPSSANFILVEVHDANRVYNELIKQNIIVRNRSSQIKNCLRISIGTPNENNRLLHTLKQIQ